MIYFILALFPAGFRLANLLLPLPLVLLIITAWTFMTWIILQFADQIGDRPTSGPALECVSMTMLFMPTIILGVWVPPQLSDDVTWKIMPGILVGISFASVISTPFRRFLLDLGRLPSNPRYKV